MADSVALATLAVSVITAASHLFDKFTAWSHNVSHVDLVCSKCLTLSVDRSATPPASPAPEPAVGAALPAGPAAPAATVLPAHV